jgi:hypothetical protein
MQVRVINRDIRGAAGPEGKYMTYIPSSRFITDFFPSWGGFRTRFHQFQRLSIKIFVDKFNLIIYSRVITCIHPAVHLVGRIEGKNLLYRGTIPFCLHIVP